MIVATVGVSAQADSLIVDNQEVLMKKKKWFVPLAEVTALNVIVNRYDVWIQDADWARVSFSSWKNNFKRGFKSDPDKFINNFLLHPIHGSLYYNSARSLGYNFWESAGFTLGGSLMWEFLGETYAPSEIDINTTVQGGMYLGEMGNRISKSLLRDNKRRPNKVLRNIAATALNPMGQFNRWCYDDVKNSFYSDKVEETAIRSQLSLGVSIPTKEFDRINALTTLHANYSMLYGDLFKPSSSFKPFDFFVLRSWIDIGTSDEIKPVYINIVSHAAWFRKQITDNSVFSVSQHYDYVDNQAFKIGMTGVTADYTLRQNYGKWGFVGSANLGIIPFGSSSSTVVDAIEFGVGEEEFNAEYVYGRGFVSNLEYMIYHSKLGRITSTYSYWHLNTEDYAQGVEKSSILQFRYYCSISKDYSVGVEFLQYGRNAKYDDIPEFEDIREDYEEIKIFVSTTF